MTLGKGLESLIPPRDNKNEPQNQTPQFAPDEVVKKDEVIVKEEKSLTTEIPPSINYGEIMPENSIYARPSEEEKIEGAVFQIEIDKISPNPHQPRRHFDEDALRELAMSIREFGILQPLVISKIETESATGWNVRYELVAGERRLMAAKLAGLHTVPAIIRREPSEREKLELAVIENIQREDLNPIEFARAVARLQDEFGFTQREIAARIGKSREAIANAVRLLSLPTVIQSAVAEGKITESHARLLLSIEDASFQNEVFEDILKYKLNVRETDGRIRKGRVSTTTSEEEYSINPEIESLKGKLEEFLGTKIDLQSRGKSGKITISFYSPEELESIVDKVTKQNDSQSLLPPSEFSI